jgi:hypothetical protein
MSFHSIRTTVLFRKIAVSISCLFVTMSLCVRGYPTGAPPEACRLMIPGHGVPAQTGTSNPYRIMTTKTTFSCPGDTVTGQIHRFFYQIKVQ